MMCTRVRFRILASRLPSARATGAQTHTRDARRHLSHVGRPWTRSGDADDDDDALTRLSRVSRRSAREDTRANSKRCPAAIPRLVALVVVALSRNARESAVTTGAMTTTSSSSRASLSPRGIRARTWNVAAINNNPFEYYASSSTTTTTTTEDDDEKSTYDAFTRAVEDQLATRGLRGRHEGRDDECHDLRRVRTRARGTTERVHGDDGEARSSALRESHAFVPRV
tara:strand:+ start:304 stop:981 length:678 start_codon:yes stop_codon:yes gene_type:complete